MIKIRYTFETQICILNLDEYIYKLFILEYFKLIILIIYF